MSAAIADKISTLAARKVLDDELAVHRFTHVGLAGVAYSTIFTGKAQAMIRALPDGWLPSNYYIQVKYGDGGAEVINLEFSGGLQAFDCFKRHSYININDPERIWRPFPSKDRERMFDMRSDFDFCAQIAMHIASVHESAKRYHELRRETHAAVYRFSTVEKLVDAWPEIAPFAVQATPVTVAALPAIPLEDLNTRLGLIASPA